MRCIVCAEQIAFGSLLVYLDKPDAYAGQTVAHAGCFAKTLRALHRTLRAFQADLANAENS